jgi:hypothetical protein
MKIKYFVVSLPRTGTTSLSKMARICGLNPKHAPHEYWKSHIENDIFDFFSDTPIFDPKVVDQICKMDQFIPKFIFIDRGFDEIFRSWVKMGLYDNYKSFYGNIENFDFVSYNNAFQNKKMDDINYFEIFETHKKTVIDLINESKKDLLIYNFNMGWNPFCEFLGCEIPSEEIPKLNTNTFFDPY